MRFTSLLTTFAFNSHPNESYFNRYIPTLCPIDRMKITQQNQTLLPFPQHGFLEKAKETVKSITCFKTKETHHKERHVRVDDDSGTDDKGDETNSFTRIIWKENIWKVRTCKEPDDFNPRHKGVSTTCNENGERGNSFIFYLLIYFLLFLRDVSFITTVLYRW